MAQGRPGTGSASPGQAPQSVSAWQGTFHAAGGGASPSQHGFQSPSISGHASVSPPLQQPNGQVSLPFLSAGRGSASPPFGLNQQQHQPMYTDFSTGNSFSDATASSYGQNQGYSWSKPPISLDTAQAGQQQLASPPFWQDMSGSEPMGANAGGSSHNGALSATTLAFLAAANGSASLDPTMAVYDENSGGYATPSYAGSVADDSSFDDRDFGSHSPFSRPLSQQFTPDIRADLNQPFLHAGSDLYAFRDTVRQSASDWDSASSVSGAADEVHSVHSRASPGNINASPELGPKVYVNEGNGLEMAVGRMFAPMPSPKVFPPSPVRDDTLRANSSSPGEELEHIEPVFTASPSHSPQLAAQDTSNLPTVPTFSRLSPSPSSPGFKPTATSSTAQDQQGQPSLKSPPLRRGPGWPATTSDQTRLSALAPLAIPATPDLTLTTATPTAVPRTATARQDSTQAALDTVFSTFFDKANRPTRTDSLDSRPDTTLPPEASQALFDIPVHDMTLPLGGGQMPKPMRQRSKSDTYMNSPMSFDAPAGFSFRVHQPGDEADGQPQTGSVDPRNLEVQSPLPAIPSPAHLGMDQIKIEGKGSEAGDDGLSASKDSQAGPSARRKSVLGASSPYDAAFSPANISPGNQISPTGQVFLVPPTSATRRSRSPGGGNHSGHRAVRSEDYRGSGTFTPRTAQFLIDTPTSIQVPGLPDMPVPNPTMDGQRGYQPIPDFFQGHSAFFDNFQNATANLPSQTTNDLQNDLYNAAGMGNSSYAAFNIPVDVNGNIVPPDAMQMGTGYYPNNSAWPPNAAYNNGNGGGRPGQIVYSALDDDNLSVQVDPRSLANRGRRRSSVRSDTSGYSGISGAGSEGVTLESKTTEATKQAARRRRKDPNNAKFSCDYCGETFTRAYNLKGHIRSHEGSKPFGCVTCGKGFARRHDLKRHELLHTGEKKYLCEACKTPFVRLDALQRHHKSENGAACVAQIKELAEQQGVDMSTFAGVDMSEFIRGVEL